MSQSKKPTNELADENTAETAVDEGKTVAQILLEKKAAAVNNRNLPPHLNSHRSHKGQKIGEPPRGTRKTMGKR